MEPKSTLSRGLALRWIAALPVVALAARPRLAQAQSQKLSFFQAGYTIKRSTYGANCARCVHFVPASGSSQFGHGSCTVVEGNISARGWCQYYAGRDGRDARGHIRQT